MVTWKSASTSSRNASNASSLRSSSSISSTGAPAGSGSSACSSGRLIRKRSENTSCSIRSLSRSPLGFGGADRDHLRGVVPFVHRRRDVEPLVALQADQPAAQSRGQHLGDLGLADAGLAFEEDRPVHLQRQEQHRRQRAVGEIAGLAEELQCGVDGDRNGFVGVLFHHQQLTPSGPASLPSIHKRMPGTRPGMTPYSMRGLHQIGRVRLRPLRLRQRPPRQHARPDARGIRRCRGCRRSCRRPGSSCPRSTSARSASSAPPRSS